MLEEDQVERVQSLLAEKTNLTGKALEDQAMDVLWKHQNEVDSSIAPPARNTIVRAASPSPWQMPRATTPRLGSTPPLGPGSFGSQFGLSPFPSPRPSPRLAYSSPIPHSPSLNAYEPIPVGMTETFTPDVYGDFGSDTVDWLLADEAGGQHGIGLHMSPYDMLRAVLGEHTDEEMEKALEASGYDLSTALSMLSDKADKEKEQQQKVRAETLIGKSLTPTPTLVRPATPRSGVICRFFLSTGQCLRADCRFSHDLGTTICKYWLTDSCLAGDTCIFSHDPTTAAVKLHQTEGLVSGNASPSTPPAKLAVQDANAFPALTPEYNGNGNGMHNNHGYHHGPPVTPRSAYRQLHHSRPNSRAAHRDNHQIHHHNNHRNNHIDNRPNTPQIPSVDDTEAFPSLGAVKPGKKKDKNRNVGTSGASTPNGINIPTGPASLADVVRNSPTPSPAAATPKRWGPVTGHAPPSSPKPRPRPVSAASTNSIPPNRPATPSSATSIPAPQQTPWLTPSMMQNKPYLRHRQASYKHAHSRNKFLQAAAAAWARNDAKAAKSLGMRGAAENEAMKKEQRLAGKALYERTGVSETWIDVQGCAMDELAGYVEKVLKEQKGVVYVFCGNLRGKEKVGKWVKGVLNEWGLAWREWEGRSGVVGVWAGQFEGRPKRIGGSPLSESSEPVRKDEDEDLVVGNMSDDATSPTPAPATPATAKVEELDVTVPNVTVDGLEAVVTGVDVKDGVVDSISVRTKMARGVNPMAKEWVGGRSPPKGPAGMK